MSSSISGVHTKFDQPIGARIMTTVKRPPKMGIGAIVAVYNFFIYSSVFNQGDLGSISYT
jgi:hypothetical protein